MARRGRHAARRGRRAEVLIEYRQITLGPGGTTDGLNLANIHRVVQISLHRSVCKQLADTFGIRWSDVLVDVDQQIIFAVVAEPTLSLTDGVSPRLFLQSSSAPLLN